MATGSRTLWKGAITFGLVHIPVGLHTAATPQGVDFDWLDKRSMDPVGYKRINKRTGKEIAKEHIVKGVQYEDGKYVIISPEEIEAVFPKTTQTIEIERFIEAMIAIRGEIDAVIAGEYSLAESPLRNAPHTAAAVVGDEWTRPYTREQAAFPVDRLRQDKYFPPVGRIDGAFGDRNLVCACPAPEAFEI